MKPKNSILPADTYNESSLMNGVACAKNHTPPTLKEGKVWYIEFYAYDPAQGKLRRKRIKVNRIEGVKTRRAYARDIIGRLNEQLSRGWNPWVASDPADLVLFEELLDRFEVHNQKMLASGYHRPETYAGYKSNVKILRQYISKERPLHYVYQFNKSFCVDFLDYIFIDRGNGAQTRNNYLNFLRVLSGFAVDKGYLQARPTDGISPISKRLYTKQRECLPADAIGKLADYAAEKDPYFLLACYLLYYCFIRPVEMTRLTVGCVNVKDCTITIPASASKNKQTQVVTMPLKVLEYANGLGVFDAASSDYLFSVGLRPGIEAISTKIFRDHWESARKALGFDKTWKFYSLKDTGITAMCEANMASIDVRDQARHSSLAITDIYTRHKVKANKDIVSLDGDL